MASPIRFLKRRAGLLLGLLLALGAPIFIAAPAQAAQYRVLLCAAGAGQWNQGTAGNTASPQNPAGIFNTYGSCPANSSDPAGDSALLKIWENQASGNAGNGAFEQIYWDSPAFTHFKTAGAYTRQPSAFNAGWRSRLMGVDFANNTEQFITQAPGLPNQGEQANSTNVFAPHVWPFPEERDFHRFIFEMLCVRSTGCDRSGLNETDINDLKFTMNDDQDSQVGFTNQGASPFLSGQWVRGGQSVTWHSSDNGSGIRFERVFIDNSDLDTIDYQALGQCDVGATGNSGEFAKQFSPCPQGGPWEHGWSLDTGSLADGTHALSVCTQDFGQFQGLNGTGGQTCTNTTIHTDNTAPGAPAGLEVTSQNPARYLDHFDAHWTLPPNEGSPITAIHYEILDAAGNVVVPEKVVSGSDLSQLSGIKGPSKPGDYRLKLWLEDQVGFSGAPSIAPIPHDTTPPAAPQEISVVAPMTSRGAQGLDVHWRNITDSGSQINAVHYQVLDSDGDVVVPTQTVSGNDVRAIQELDAPSERGTFALRMWLSDEEGNEGAPATAPLSYACSSSHVGGGTQVSAGLGKNAASRVIVQQGTGALLTGDLKDGRGSGVDDASVCVFSRVVTDSGREYLGSAVTDQDGSYQFAVPAGASRDLTVAYRYGHREIEGTTQLRTVVHPTFQVQKRVAYNHHRAVFFGHVPGPHNDRVVVTLEVKIGKGKHQGGLAFHRYSTRAGGNYKVAYRFLHTYVPTEYMMQAEVRPQSGFPYVRGKSKPLRLIVLPHKNGREQLIVLPHKKGREAVAR
jgi:hypothetical protein